MTRVIKVSDETFRRLQEFGTAFRGSERGTPDKTIRALLDGAESRRRLGKRFFAEPGEMKEVKS